MSCSPDVVQGNGRGVRCTHRVMKQWERGTLYAQGYEAIELNQMSLEDSLHEMARERVGCSSMHQMAKERVGCWLTSPVLEKCIDHGHVAVVRSPMYRC